MALPASTALGEVERPQAAKRPRTRGWGQQGTGKEEDVEVGLQYFGKRYYAPLLNRWVSADPLAVHGLGADLNVYAYVSGRALQSIDPMGLEESRVSSVADTGLPAPQPTRKADGTIEMPEMVVTGDLRALAPPSEAWRQGPSGGSPDAGQCWGGGSGCIGNQKIPVETIAFPGEPGGAAATLGGITANKVAGHEPTAQDWAAFGRAGAAEMLGRAGGMSRAGAQEGGRTAPSKSGSATGAPSRAAAKPAPSPRAAGADTRLVFEPSPKHGAEPRGKASAGPKHGQAALDYSIPVKSTSPRRVGIDYDAGEFVVFDEHLPGRFHGHVRTWAEMTTQMQSVLIKAGMASRKGKILTD